MNDERLRELEERFLRYVRIDSQSDEHSATVPSTEIQWDILQLLEQELREVGAEEIELSDNGFVMATLPATQGMEEIPTAAFLAHVDTAPAFAASGVVPIVHRNYDGSPIAYPDDAGLTLDPETFPYLAQKVGDHIVTASGTTLLGADDKAGIAIIMTLASSLSQQLDIPHGRIRICFTPDEEIGTGVRHLNLEHLDADIAYTLDGMCVGELTYETFSADKAVISIEGVSTHTGTALGVMVNALQLVDKLLNALPQHTRTPETTSGMQGFIHPYELTGTAAVARLSLILRDFELEGLRAHGDFLRTLCDALQQSEPRARITLEISPQYRNMRYWLENDMRSVELAEAAFLDAGIEAVFTPIRGGTDGSQLTERGLPTPNLFTGMQNPHGPLEWISLQDMEKATDVCLRIIRLLAEGSLDN